MCSQAYTLVVQGVTNAQIAAELSISVRPVSSHLDRVRDLSLIHI